MNEVHKLLDSRFPGLHAHIERVLVECEAAFNGQTRHAPSAFLLEHTRHTAAIAHALALHEGVDPWLAVLVALFHDAGKFHDGGYHGDKLPEEEHAARLAQTLLAEHDVPCSDIGAVMAALRALYDDRQAIAPASRIVQDADRLAKLGALGVGAFFTKATLRGRGLVDSLAGSLSRELTYALAAPRSMLTESGRKLAREQAAKTVAFFDGLLGDLENWGIAAFERRTLALEGDFSNREGGRVTTMEVIIVTHRRCPECEGTLNLTHRRERGVKCETLVARLACRACGQARETSFCLPAFA